MSRSDSDGNSGGSGHDEYADEGRGRRHGRSSMDLSIRACFAGGWDFYKRFMGLLYLAGLVTFAIQAGFGIALMVVVFFVFKTAGLPTAGLLTWGGLEQNAVLFSAGILTLPFNFTAYMVVARAMRGEQMFPADILKGFNRYFVILASAVIMTAALYTVIPGLFLIAGLVWAPALVVDRGMGVIESLRASWTMMNGCKLQLCILFAALILFNILGLAAVLVGIIVTYPVSVCVWIYFYNRVSDQRLGASITSFGEAA